MQSDPTIDQIIENMPARFRPENTKGISAVLQFRLTGDNGADFFANIENQTCRVERGQHHNPTLTMKMAAQTYIDMIMGRLSGQEAFFKRKLQYSGPITLAVKLHTFFKPPEFAK